MSKTKEEIEEGLFNGMTAEQLLEWLDKRCNFNDHQKDYVHLIIIKLIKSTSLELFKEKLKKDVEIMMWSESLTKTSERALWQNDSYKFFIHLIDTIKP